MIDTPKLDYPVCSLDTSDKHVDCQFVFVFSHISLSCMVNKCNASSSNSSSSGVFLGVKTATSDTCVLGHVVFQLSRPFALVAALRTKVLLLFLVNSHVKL